MQEVTRYPHATFSWLDLSSTDADAARAFYTGLFGWTARDVGLPGGGAYTMFELHGRPVAGLAALSKEMVEAGWGSSWTNYLNVDDADAVAAAAREAGAEIIEAPFDVMEEGRMAYLKDPTGAAVGLWQARKHPGAGYVNVPGAMVWNELATPDPEAAVAFYERVLGWTHETAANGYVMFRNGDRYAAGAMDAAHMGPDAPPAWTVYFAVEDCAAAVARAEELGGEVLVPPSEIPDTGTFAALRDPAGGAFCVIEMLVVDPPPQA